jgi:hypothetical protein
MNRSNVGARSLWRKVGDILSPTSPTLVKNQVGASRGVKSGQCDWGIRSRSNYKATWSKHFVQKKKHQLNFQVFSEKIHYDKKYESPLSNQSNAMIKMKNLERMMEWQKGQNNASFPHLWYQGPNFHAHPKISNKSRKFWKFYNFMV